MDSTSVSTTALEHDFATELEPTTTADAARSTHATRVDLRPADAQPAPAADRGRIVGSVRDAVDRVTPVARGFVRVEAEPAPAGLPRDAVEELRLFVAMPVAAIDKEGGFAFPSIPFGAWSVTLDVDGCEKREARVTLSAEAPEARVEFMTRLVTPVALTVALTTAAGTPWFESADRVDAELSEEAQLVILPSCPMPGVRLDQTGFRMASGQIALTGKSDPWAVLDVPDSESGCACAVLAGVVVGSAPFAARQSRVEIAVSSVVLAGLRGSAEVLVVEADSRLPIAGAHVMFRSGRDRIVEAVTDPHGWARSENLTSGKLVVVAWNEGFQRTESESNVRGGGPPERVTIALSRAVKISGRMSMSDAAGGWLPIRLHVLGPRIVERAWEQTDQNGDFTFSDLEPAEYAIAPAPLDRPDPKLVRRGEQEGWTYVDARGGSVEGLRIVISKARLAASGIELPSFDARELMRRRIDRR